MGSASVGHVLRAIRVWPCHAAPGSAMHALACAGGLSHRAALTGSRGYSRGTHNVLTWAIRAPPSSSKFAFCRIGCFEGTRCALQQSLGDTGMLLVWCGTIGTIGYSWGSHWVLKEYGMSRTDVPRRLVMEASHSVGQSTAPRGALCGVSRGLYCALRVLRVLIASSIPAEKKRKEAPLVGFPRALRLPFCPTTAVSVCLTACVQRRQPFRARPRRPTSATPTRPRARRRRCRRGVRTSPTRRVRAMRDTLPMIGTPHGTAA
jgi:hypothetical protein